MRSLARSCSLALAAGIAFALPLNQAAAESSLSVKVIDPKPVAFDLTSFGRSTHRVRVIFLNETKSAIVPTPRRFRIIASRDGLTYPCEEPTGEERWPHRVEPRDSITIDLSVRCETPLPGKYDLDVRARARGGAEEDEQSIATSAITIEPGPTPPVRLPTDSRLWVASATTKEIPPAKNAVVRIVVGLVNGSKTEVGLSNAQATVKISRHGASTPACPPKTIELPFYGTLTAGRARPITTPMTCDLSGEGTYDVDVTLIAPARVHLGTHAVRAIAVPLPHPGPTGTLPADLTP